jgi:sterol 3beta-glucosyltransferase
MRIDILAIGSRGDVQPCIALGVGLQRAGYRARLITLGGFESTVRERGLRHLSIGGAHASIAGSAEGRAWAQRRHGVVGFARGFISVATSLIQSGIADYWQAGDHADALIVTTMGLPVGGHIAERLQVPLIRASFAPTRHDWAGRRNPVTALRADWEMLKAAVFRQLLWTGLRPVTNRARHAVLGLPPLSLREPYSAMNARHVPVLDAYSPSVVPPPPGCGSWIHVTGYWFLEDLAGWTPPRELVDFLEAGSPAVFLGFGSTPFPNPDAATSIVVQALRRARQRGIVVAGGSGLATGRLADDVLSVDSVPHHWLFPRVSAAVHHGGAGVTGAALQAGLPSVVVPIFGDQPFWGRRVCDLGVGAPPIRARRLSADRLADAIQLTMRSDLRRRAAALGNQIRGEDGIARAIEAIQDHLDQPKVRGTGTYGWQP